METKFHSSQAAWSTEKQHMMNVMGQHEAHIQSLHSQLQTTSGQNATMSKQLVQMKRMVRQLSKFATGCNRYAKESGSGSVKKMADALMGQVKGWSESYHVDLGEEGDEMSSMEQIQALHLEIKELKRHNATLRDRIRGRSSRGNMSSGASCSGGSVISGIDNSDDASHFSGMTTMTTGTMATSKLIDAMSGFLNDFESKQNNTPSRRRQRVPPSNPNSATKYRQQGSSSSSVSPAVSPPRPTRKVQMNTTPQILNKDENVMKSPRSIMKQRPSYSGGSSVGGGNGSSGRSAASESSSASGSASSVKQQPKHVVQRTEKSAVCDNTNPTTTTSSTGFANFDDAFGEDFADNWSEV